MAIIAAIYHIEAKNELAIIKSTDLSRVNLLKEIVSSDFEPVVSDLIILSESSNLQALLEINDKYSLKALSEEFLFLIPGSKKITGKW